MEILHLPAHKINTDNRILLEDKKTIKELKKSIEEVGLLEPILITKDYYIISGLNRYLALSQMNREIPCIVSEEDSNLKLQLMEIDSNYVSRQLTKWDKSVLLAKRKEKYEEENPSSTKEYKSINNIKPETEKENDLPESYSSFEANRSNCSERGIDKDISNINKIKNKYEKSIETLSKFDKASSKKLKGVEIEKFANLSIEEMKIANKIVEENIDNRNFEFSQLFLKNKDNHSLEEQVNLILRYELSKCFNKDFDFDIKIVEEYKKKLKIDFFNTLNEFLLIKE